MLGVQSKNRVIRGDMAKRICREAQIIQNNKKKENEDSKEKGKYTHTLKLSI